MNKDYYSILGVDKNASEQDIRKAFLKLSKKYHPDMQSGKTDKEKKDAEEKFKEINEANEVLSNKEKRHNYDTFGTAEGQQSSFGAGGMDPREFFRKFSHGFPGGFGNFSPFGDDFGFGGSGFENSPKIDPNAPKDGRSIKIGMSFDLEDILYGINKDIELMVGDPCDHCHGTGAENGKTKECPVCHGSGMESRIHGHMMMSTTCSCCNGSGYIAEKKCSHCDNGVVRNKRKINIDIPVGIDAGQMIKVPNEGEKGVNGGRNGDLYIVIDIKDHDIFERRDRDLIEKIYISPIKASIGGSVDVQTPWGTASVTIPSGTSNGKSFRLHGQGIHSQYGNGDLYVVCEIEPFTNLSEEQKKIIEKLEKTLTDKNLKSSTELKNKCDNFRTRMKITK